MNGIFILLWTDDGYVVKGKFWQQGDVSVIDNLLMRITLSHESKKEFSKIPTQNDTFIYSRLYEFRDSSRVSQKVIVGVEITKDESQDDYKKFLIDACSKVPELLTKDEGEIEQLLMAIFASQSASQSAPTEEAGKDLLTKLKERAKDLIKNGEIDEANDLLEKAKTAPGALQKLMDKGAKLIKQKKIEEAQKVYADAIDLALSIQEGDLAAKLQDDITRVSERPKIIERIMDIEENARKAIREEDMKNAADLYKDAATEAVKLNDVDAMNEFTKKSQALIEFYTAGQKKKRSF
ncbi:MAG TPA: hypothetical protein VKM55_26060 [Candidatus Lokiarchaeia archaeon]|nr:hypothetical protein [Candidatus Lokiarchaeia archaeon]